MTMSRILSGVFRAMNLLLGPLAVGTVIFVLYLWATNPLVLLAGGVVLGFLIAVSFNQVISDAE